MTHNSGTRFALITRGRFDDEDLDLNRGEINAIGAYGDSVASVGYAYIRESPSAGIFDTRQEVSSSASLELVDNWSVLGGLIYDLENDSTVSRSFGLAYADDCFLVSAVYTETPDLYSDLATDRQVFVRINLRTLGDSDLTTDLIDEN